MVHFVCTKCWPKIKNTLVVRKMQLQPIRMNDSTFPMCPLKALIRVHRLHKVRIFLKNLYPTRVAITRSSSSHFSHGILRAWDRRNVKLSLVLVLGQQSAKPSYDKDCSHPLSCASSLHPHFPIRSSNQPRCASSTFGAHLHQSWFLCFTFWIVDINVTAIVDVKCLACDLPMAFCDI